MNNFSFYNPTRIIFGKDIISTLSTYIPPDARILLLYGGKSAKATGTLSEVQESLKGYTYFEFSGIEPNPQYETLLKAVEIIQEKQVNFLLAIGGGSVIDGTKFISLAAKYSDDPWNIITTSGACCTDALPIGVVLTVPATGSEMNPVGVISKSDTQDKLSFRHQLVFPKFSLLDPTKAFTLSKNQIRNGLVDSFVHVIEQYLTVCMDAKIPDYFSEGVLKTLIECADDLLQKEQDYKAYANFMWATTVALNGLLATGVIQDWSTHKISHELTALYGLDHGKTLAIILPAVLKTMKIQKKDKLIRYAKNVWQLSAPNDDELVDLAIKKTEDFLHHIGMLTQLSDYDIKEADIPDILNNLKRHNLIALGENKNITLDVSKNILYQAL